MKKLLTALVAGVALAMSACTSPETADRVLRQQGYSDVKAEGYAWLSCGKDDSVRTAFSAKAPNGDRVTGAVCGGLLFKNNTVRLD